MQNWPRVRLLRHWQGCIPMMIPALHRVESIHPYDRERTMGRYFERFGPSLYMCYGETDDRKDELI